MRERVEPGARVRAVTSRPELMERRYRRAVDDGWTIVTADGSLSAQFEHTVLVTRAGCEILTRGP
jgi:methionyl aminopeptidase